MEHAATALTVESPAEVEQAVRTSGIGSTAVGKALSLLSALGSGRPAEPLTVLATRAGLPKSTACRVLKMMETLGFVARQGPMYCLGPRVVELAAAASASAHDTLRTASAHALDRLFDEVRTTVHLGVLTGPDVLYLEKITASGGVHIPTRVGRTQPATCTALGKAQLAFLGPDAVRTALDAPRNPWAPTSTRTPQNFVRRLAEVRQTGVAFDHEEFRAGLSCVAVPIMVAGRPVAAISASSVRGPANTVQRMTSIRRAARTIGLQLERSGWSQPA